MIHRYPAGFRQGWHDHHEAVVCLVIEGHARESVRGSDDVVVGPLQVGVKPVGLRHADHFGPAGTRALRLSFAAEEVHGLGRFAQPLHAWGWTADARTVGAVLAATAQDDERDAKHEVLAALAAGSAHARGRPPDWLARVHVSLHDGYRQPIGLAAVARLHGVHPVYLARLFRRYYGRSVGEYLRELRLRDALGRLLRTDASIATIAAVAGFADQAHLTRHMRAALGTTPAALRRRVRALPVRDVQDSRAAGR